MAFLSCRPNCDSNKKKVNIKSWQAVKAHRCIMGCLLSFEACFRAAVFISWYLILISSFFLFLLPQSWSLRSEFHQLRPGEIKESQEDFLMIHLFIVRCFYKSVVTWVWFHFFSLYCLVPKFWNLCRDKYDFLERLPVPLLLYIISFLELEDIARLSQVSHWVGLVSVILGRASSRIPGAAGLFRRQRAPGPRGTAGVTGNGEDPRERRERLRSASYIYFFFLTYNYLWDSVLWETIVENLCDTITPEMKELAQEVGWKPFLTHICQLKEEAETRCSEQITE
ncbi:F-box only protein 36 [Neopelma chrysocephalum]|uniref:F-box only protein 36 n=1 Tax=Neopelma chrysocephalum TaxID=114329 RepID=UPI000FCD1E94|nr:F-box only protein 36 [Neopelma chrysocephalum]